MSADSEHNVRAGELVLLGPDAAPRRSSGERTQTERRARIGQRAEERARYRAILEAGGPEAWIERELRAQALVVDTDPSTLTTDAERTAYKAQKRAEADARRTLRRAVWSAQRASQLLYLGEGVFFRERDDETPPEREARIARAERNGLTGLESVDALCAALGVTPSALRWLCFQRPVDAGSHYHLWTIPKRDGSRRTISAPKAELKAVQRWLLRHVFERLGVHNAAHGFLPARSIVSNARPHAGSALVLKLDLRDFFPSITFRRVKGLLRQAGLVESVATVCALLATEAPREVVQFRGATWHVATGPRQLPQGAPTSPAITNALAIRLDRRLSGLARALGFVYTRYADDLTFSLASSADKQSERKRAPIGTLLRAVRTIVESEGFRIHDEKTRVLRGGMSQRVTGLVINRAGADVPPARVPRETIRRLRAALYNREQGRPSEGRESLAQLKGMAAFVHMADPAKGRVFLARIAALEAHTAT